MNFRYPMNFRSCELAFLLVSYLASSSAYCPESTIAYSLLASSSASRLALAVVVVLGLATTIHHHHYHHHHIDPEYTLFHQIHHTVLCTNCCILFHHSIRDYTPRCTHNHLVQLSTIVSSEYALVSSSVYKSVDGSVLALVYSWVKAWALG